MYLDYTISASKTQYTFETRTCKKQTFRGIFFLFTPQNPARHERCDCCGTRHSAPGPPKMRPSRFIAALYYYSLFFFSILFNFINSQLFYTKLVLIFYRKCVIMPCLKVFIRSPQQRHKLLRFTPVGRKKPITRHAAVIIEAKYLEYSHSFRIICPISCLIFPQVICRRYLGANTIWYLHSHCVCAKLFVSSFIQT